MPSFTTRVELHRATGEDYERLHLAMEKRGFSRTITSDKGVRYDLPTAEYDRSGSSLTRAEVRDDAKAAASSVTKSYSVLVTESNGRTWHGLEKV
jgi:hypothetical protein